MTEPKSTPEVSTEQTVLEEDDLFNALRGFYWRHFAITAVVALCFMAVAFCVGAGSTYLYMSHKFLEVENRQIEVNKTYVEYTNYLKMRNETLSRFLENEFPQFKRANDSTLVKNGRITYKGMGGR